MAMQPGTPEESLHEGSCKADWVSCHSKTPYLKP